MEDFQRRTLCCLGGRTLSESWGSCTFPWGQAAVIHRGPGAKFRTGGSTGVASDLVLLRP